MMERQEGDSGPLDTDQLLLIEARVANEKRSTGLAYVLWLFLGLLGIHNYYLGKPLLATFQLLGVLATFGLVMAGNFGIALVVFFLWVLSFIVDAFLIPSRVLRHTQKLRAAIARQIRSRVS